jgi:hypothetical protein
MGRRESTGCRPPRFSCPRARSLYRSGVATRRVGVTTLKEPIAYLNEKGPREAQLAYKVLLVFFPEPGELKKLLQFSDRPVSEQHIAALVAERFSEVAKS